MKIKISYLVNKVINREEMPKEVLFDGNIYKWCGDIGDYRKDGWGSCLMIRDVFDSFDRYDSFYNMLFEYVEIIEEPKKIEKLPYYSLEKIQKSKNKDEWYENRLKLLEKRINDYHDKFNELIDEINNLKEK